MSGSLDCRAARELFSPAWDGVLDPASAERLAFHLAGCAGCRAEKDSYDRFLGGLGPSLRAAVESESPARPFPAEPASPPAWRAVWLKPVLLGFSALAIAAVALDLDRRGDLLPRVARPASRPAATPCPWRKATPEEVRDRMSYPVIADPCLAPGYELVEARVRDGSEWDERVRLTYRAGGHTLVLEQARAQVQASCPAERVVLEELKGCLEPEKGGGTALTWSQGASGFRLEGDLPPADTLEVARAIAENAVTH